MPLGGYYSLRSTIVLTEYTTQWSSSGFLSLDPTHTVEFIECVLKGFHHDFILILQILIGHINNVSIDYPSN